MKYVIINIILLGSLITFSQSTYKLEKEVDRLMSYKNPQTYKRALDKLIELDKKGQYKNPIYRYKIAICYLNTNIDKQKALEYLESIKENEEEFGYGFYFHIGQAYHYGYRFDDAIYAYNKFLSLAKKKDERKQTALRSIEMCKIAKDMVNNPIDVKIENLGSNVNSEGTDYTPVISADESVLIFTSSRQGCVGGKRDAFGKPDDQYGDYFDDIFVTYKAAGKWTKPLNIGSQINTSGHDAAISLSPDGHNLFVYRDDTIRWGNIFSCIIKGEKFSSPKKLPSPINTRYWEGSCSISSDGETMFFSSNRPGGYGGKDIYMIKKLPSGEWGDPFNLGPTVNTKFNEDAPFIHVDGKTLFFSSKGHNSMGGYDIFKTTYNDDNKWSTTTNLKYPINSTEDDIFFVLSADGKRGYYACTKKDGFGEQDIYIVNFPEDNEVKPEPVTIFTGKIYSKTGKFPEEVKIIVSDMDSGDKIGEYNTNIVTGKFLIVLPQGRTYNIIINAPGHQEQSATIETDVNNEFNEIVKDFTLNNF